MHSEGLEVRTRAFICTCTSRVLLVLVILLSSSFLLGFVLVLVFLFAYAAHCELLVQEGTKGSTELLLWGIRYVISPFLSFFLLSIEKVKQLKKKKNQSLK